MRACSGAPALVEQALVGHVVQRVRAEAVTEVGKEGGLVKQLGAAQLVEAAPHVARRAASAMASSSRTGTSSPMTDAAWRSRFCSGGQAVDARGEHGAHAGGHLQGRRRPDAGDRRRARPPRTPVSDEAPHALLEEERVAPAALGEERLHGGRGLGGAEERSRAAPAPPAAAQRARGAAEHSPAPVPPVVVLGPVGDEQRACGAAVRGHVRRAPRARLGVHPLQILEHQHDRLARAQPVHQADEQASTARRRRAPGSRARNGLAAGGSPRGSHCTAAMPSSSARSSARACRRRPSRGRRPSSSPRSIWK